MILETKIHKASDPKNISRPAMRGLGYDPRGCGPVSGPVLLATNGRIAAVVSVDVSEEPETPSVPVCIPPEAVEAAWKASKNAPGKRVALSMNGSVRAPYPPGNPTFAYTEAEFPRVAPLFPASAPAVRVSLNAEFLATLAESIGSTDGAVELELRAGGGPIVVRRIDGTPGRDLSAGLIMPIGNGTEVLTAS